MDRYTVPFPAQPERSEPHLLINHDTGERRQFASFTAAWCEAQRIGQNEYEIRCGAVIEDFGPREDPR